MSGNRLVAFLISFLFAAAASLPARAQEPRRGTIESITVTARKKEESVQEAPLAVTAISGLQMEQQSVEDFVDLQYTIPNITLGQSQATGSTAFVAIRGITSSEFTPSVDSGVSLYLDGLCTSRMVGAITDMLDLERAEVLRGPQGTLFGRNTTGGAIALYSRRPDGNYDGRLTFGLGTDNRWETKGAIGLPIFEDVLSARVAWSLRSRDNFSESDFTGDEFEDQRIMQFKGSLRWTPNERTDIVFIADRRKARNEYSNAKLRIVDSQELFPNLLPPLQAATGGSLPPLPTFTGSSRDSDADGRATAYQGTLFGDRQDDDLWGFVLDASFDIGDDLTLRSLSGHRRLKAKRSGDNDGSPYDVFASADDFGNKAYQQELQLTGTAADARMSWTAGVFGYYEESFNDAVQPVLTDTTTLTTVLAAGPCPLGAPTNPTELACYINGSSFNNQDAKNWSYAGYFEADFNLTDRLILTGGVRYTVERRETKYRRRVLLDGVYNGIFPAATGAPALPTGACLLGDGVGFVAADLAGGVNGCSRETQALRDRFWSWNTMARYHWSDSVMTFARVALAQRSGNNASRPLAQADINSTDAEKLVQYELGLKSQFLDDRLRLNASIFHSNYSDIITNVIQSTASGGIASLSLNTGRRYIQGLELEVNTVDLLFPGLSLDFSLGLLNNRVNHDTRGTSFGAVDYEPIANTGSVPRAQYSISAMYEFPAFEDLGRFAGNLSLRVDWYHQGRTETFDKIVRGSGPGAGVECTGFNSTPPGGQGTIALFGGVPTPCTDPRAAKDGSTLTSDYGLLNANLSYDMPKLNTTLTIWGRNLLDEQYETGWIDFGSIGAIVSYQGAPREVGVSLTYYWD
jgi:iron complex outermembrane receptor protein